MWRVQFNPMINEAPYEEQLVGMKSDVISLSELFIKVFSEHILLQKTLRWEGTGDGISL